MNVTAITAREDEILFTLDCAVQNRRIRVSMFSPALGEEGEICSLSLSVSGSSFSVSRRIAKRDGALLCYSLSDETGDIGGVRYVTEFDFSKRDYPYPTADSKKGLQPADIGDALALGIRHAALNVNLGDILMEVPDGGNTLFYRLDGREYYVRKSAAEHLDRQVKALSDEGVLVNLILLNSRSWLTAVPDRFWKRIRHPGYEEEGNISLFDVMREEGCRYYSAFVTFLAERYTREDYSCGRIAGMIVGNEVNSPWIWANAGDTLFGDYAAQYTSALRIAWQSAARIWKNLRVYISLDHFWAGSMDSAQPTRFYSGRDLLTAIAHCCTLEGNFPWHVAHHPYPQDLFHPDFWNDDTAPDSPDAFRVTFQNLPVLIRHLALPEMRYKEESRRVILSEQGFHSDFTEAGEALQAEAYRRAWEIVQTIPEIDAFIYHAHRDNIEEGGLNLGLWRRKSDSGEPDAPKPIYEIFRTIDQ